MIRTQRVNMKMILLIMGPIQRVKRKMLLYYYRDFIKLRLWDNYFSVTLDLDIEINRKIESLKYHLIMMENQRRYRGVQGQDIYFLEILCIFHGVIILQFLM